MTTETTKAALADILASAQSSGCAHNNGAGGQYLLCATEPQLLKFAALLRASEGRVPDGYDSGTLTGNRVTLHFERQDAAVKWFDSFCKAYDAAKGTKTMRIVLPPTAAPHPPAQQAEPDDTFRGDNAALVRNIKALIELSDEGALVPHGLGGHARGLLSAAAARLPPPPPHKAEGAEPAAVVETAAKARAWDRCRASCVIRDAPLTIGDVIDTMDALLAQELATTQEPSA